MLVALGAGRPQIARSPIPSSCLPESTVTATPNLCTICGAVLAARPAGGDILCGSLSCASAYRAVPAHLTCGACRRVIPAAHRASRHCGRYACAKTVAVDRPQAAARAAQAALVVAAHKRRRARAAHDGVAAAAVESYRVSVIPKNTRRVSALPRRRRALFEASLRAQLAEARGWVARGELPLTFRPRAPEPPPTAQARRQMAVLGAGCAACRGHCCGLGKEHAFLRVDAMLHYLQRFPEKDDETIVADYLAFLSARTLTGGCVFQNPDGCALPRDMRADICNAYHCTGLDMLRDAFEDEEPVRAFFIHQVGNGLQGGRFVDIPPTAD